jgi:hypothetical protein
MLATTPGTNIPLLRHAFYSYPARRNATRGRSKRVVVIAIWCRLVAPFAIRRDAAIRSFMEDKRTSSGHYRNDATDPQETSFASIVTNGTILSWNCDRIMWFSS